MTVKVETAPTESDTDSGSLGAAEDLPGKVNCLRSLKMHVLPSTPFYQRYHVSNLNAYGNHNASLALHVLLNGFEHLNRETNSKHAWSYDQRVLCEQYLLLLFSVTSQSL
jgi:hypothetical protein